MKIVVLLSTYNGEKYLKEQLDSIISQNIDHTVDILIRDDGSKDHTIDIIKDYMKRNANIKLIVGDNIGCTPSFFKLLEIADQYDYYCICDQDDIWLEDKIETAISTLEKDKEQPALYGGCSYLVNNDLEKLSTTSKKRREINFYNTAIQNIIPGHTQVLNNNLLKLINKEMDYEKIYYYDSWIVNIAAIKGKIIFDNTPHTLYRQHTDNVLGYGISRLSWIKERVRRVKSNGSKMYAIQMKYFYDKNKEYLSNEESKEMMFFFEKQKNVFTRIKYIMNSQFYRQKKDETLMFKILYVFGGYKLK